MAMNVDDARYLKKKVKSCGVDAHPTEKALVVQYEVEATILGEMGDPMLGERKNCSKIIRVKNLTETTDVRALSEEIVNMCKLIPANKQPEVEQLLYYLQNRKDAPAAAAKDRNQLEAPSLEGTEVNEVANLNDLDEYCDLMYEDIPEKVRGAALILQLARNPDNLEELLQNETVITAVARVLREDWKKEVDLAINIIYIFFCFSSFSNFHTLIHHFKIGALCVEIVEAEIEKFEQWQLEYTKKKNSAKQKDTDKLTAKFDMLKKKQEQLLRVTLYLLLNISEEEKVEVKIHNKGMVKLLVALLDRRHNPDLLMLVVSFLKKLSVYKENKEQMKQLNIVEKLSKLVTESQHQDLLNLTLRLLLNLSFDTDLRQGIAKCGMLPSLVQLIGHEYHHATVLLLLYQISIEDRFKALFTYTDCIPIVMRLLLENPHEKPELELISLCVNLACNVRNAKLICENKGLKLLMKRAFKFKDSFILKMIRNISEHATLKSLFVDYVGDLAKAIKNNNNEDDFVIECLGILGNLSGLEIDWALVIQKCDLMPFIDSKLTSSGGAEDDMLLEIVILIGTMATDEDCAKLMADSGIIHKLIELLNLKQEDDEIVCQTIYVFYQLTFHQSTRELVLQKTQAPAYIIDLMHDKNAEIRKVCDMTLDIISELDKDWGEKIQRVKFDWHNSQWLELIESADLANAVVSNGGVGGINSADISGDSEFGNLLQNSDILDHSDLYYQAEGGMGGVGGVGGGNMHSPNYIEEIARHGSPDEMADMYGDLRMSSNNHPHFGVHPSSAHHSDPYGDPRLDGRALAGGAGRHDSLMYSGSTGGMRSMHQFAADQDSGDDDEDDEDDERNFRSESPPMIYHQATHAAAAMIAKRQDRY
ncbi:kinesin-associated protein 3-like isoform X2 [Convolutriloba macropyga]|uniref:kinesin-associated protein 3-like isoform X2 n=1 Tax=Convolutriloba macropyga TaxID=536237 RepID=UPI003F524ED2